MMTAMGQARGKILFLNIHVFLAFLSVMISKKNACFQQLYTKPVFWVSLLGKVKRGLTGNITNHKTLIYNTL